METFTIFSPPFYLYKIVTEYRWYVRWELLNNKLHCTYVAKNNFVKQKAISIVPIQEQDIKGWMWSQLQVGNSNEHKLQHAGRSLENWGYPESAETCPGPSWESFSLTRDLLHSCVSSTLWCTHSLYSHTVLLEVTIWMGKGVKFIHRIIVNHLQVSPDYSPVLTKLPSLFYRLREEQLTCELVLSKDPECDHTICQEKFSESACGLRVSITIISCVLLTLVRI